MKRLFLSLLVALTMITAISSPVSAFDPFNRACNASSKDAVACKTDSSSDSIAAQGPRALLLNITTVVAYIAGALAVVMIIVGAIQYVTAGSDVSTGSRTDTDAEDARRTIVSALAGLAVIILARTIIFYVVSRL